MVCLLETLDNLAICKCPLCHLSSVQEDKTHSDLCSDKWREIGLSRPGCVIEIMTGEGAVPISISYLMYLKLFRYPSQ